MPAIDQDGLSPGELDAVRSALARDPDLAAELDLILPALDGAGRRVFWQAFAPLAGDERPAAAVLVALITVGRARC